MVTCHVSSKHVRIVSQGSVFIILYDCLYSRSALYFQISQILSENYDSELCLVLHLSLIPYLTVNSCNVSKSWVICNETAGHTSKRRRNIRYVSYFVMLIELFHICFILWREPSIQSTVQSSVQLYSIMGLASYAPILNVENCRCRASWYWWYYYALHHPETVVSGVLVQS